MGGVMATYVLSFDPGKSNGVALGVVEEDSPYRSVQVWQFEGGAKALSGWVSENWDVCFPDPDSRDQVVTSEKYVPLSGGGFHQTLDSVEPLVGEGVLIHAGLMPGYPSPEWRRADKQYLYGGKDKAQKRKRAKEYLKTRDMYLTGKSVGCGDAEDAISAILHGISYAAQVLKHKPTFESITEWGSK